VSIQAIVVLLIGADIGVLPSKCGSPFPLQNFVANLVEAQYTDGLTDEQGASTLLGRTLDISNLFFTAVFTAELFVNMYAHWLQVWHPQADTNNKLISLFPNTAFRLLQSHQ
jgi:hypothetical protein